MFHQIESFILSRNYFSTKRPRMNRNLRTRFTQRKSERKKQMIEDETNGKGKVISRYTKDDPINLSSICFSCLDRIDFLNRVTWILANFIFFLGRSFTVIKTSWKWTPSLRACSAFAFHVSNTNKKKRMRRTLQRFFFL